MRRFVLSAVCSVLSAAVVLGSANADADPTVADLSKRLSELEKDAAHRTALTGPLENAKRALERSQRDSKGAPWAPGASATDRHSALLRAVANEWLDVAADLVRAVDAEKVATQAQKRLDDAQTRIVRGKLLLEETIARRGRTQAQLDALDKPKSEAAPPLNAAAPPAQPSSPPATPAKKATPAPVPAPPSAKPEPKE